MPSKRPRLSLTEAIAHFQERSFPDDGGDLVGLELEWLVRSFSGTGQGEMDHGQGDMDHGRLSDLVLLGGSTLSTLSVPA